MPVVRKPNPKVDDQHVEDEESSTAQEITAWEVPYLIPGRF
jgi:hypothetical protein